MQVVHLPTKGLAQLESVETRRNLKKVTTGAGNMSADVSAGKVSSGAPRHSWTARPGFLLLSNAIFSRGWLASGGEAMWLDWGSSESRVADAVGLHETHSFLHEAPTDERDIRREEKTGSGAVDYVYLIRCEYR